MAKTNEMRGSAEDAVDIASAGSTVLVAVVNMEEHPGPGSPSEPSARSALRLKTGDVGFE